MNKLHIKISLGLLFYISAASQLLAQDVVNNYQYRTALGMEYKLNKSWKVEMAPELRFDEAFSLDKILIEGNLKYKPFKIITFGATYRFEVNYRDVKETQYLNLFGFSAMVKKKIKRFERIRPSNPILPQYIFINKLWEQGFELR